MLIILILSNLLLSQSRWSFSQYAYTQCKEDYYSNIIICNGFIVLYTKLITAHCIHLIFLILSLTTPTLQPQVTTLRVCGMWTSRSLCESTKVTPRQSQPLSTMTVGSCGDEDHDFFNEPHARFLLCAFSCICFLFIIISYCCCFFVLLFCF